MLRNVLAASALAMFTGVAPVLAETFDDNVCITEAAANTLGRAAADGTMSFVMANDHMNNLRLCRDVSESRFDFGRIRILYRGKKFWGHGGVWQVVGISDSSQNKITGYAFIQIDDTTSRQS